MLVLWSATNDFAIQATICAEYLPQTVAYDGGEKVTSGGENSDHREYRIRRSRSR